MSTISPSQFSAEGARKLSPRETMQRLQALSCTLPQTNMPTCSSQLFVGIFFDGTGNNMTADFDKPPPEKRKHTNIVKLFQTMSRTIFKLAPKQRWNCWKKTALVCLLILPLSACFEEEQDSVSYQGANHTNEAAAEVTLNGQGGIMLAYEHGYSGNICCVNVPKKWRPEILVTVEWEDGGHWLLDEKGKEVIRNGNPVLVRGIRKSKIVPLPKYDTPEILWVHFFPNDEVKLVMSKYWPGHPKHGLPSPYIPGVSK